MDEALFLLTRKCEVKKTTFGRVSILGEKEHGKI
jgi:hypothetical protein